MTALDGGPPRVGQHRDEPGVRIGVVQRLPIAGADRLARVHAQSGVALAQQHPAPSRGLPRGWHLLARREGPSVGGLRWGGFSLSSHYRRHLGSLP